MGYNPYSWDTTDYVTPSKMNHIEQGIKGIDLTGGGTLKSSSGNTTLKLVGATSSDYGQIQLARNGQTMTLAPDSRISSTRTVYFPNTNGSCVVGSNHYNDGVTANANETWGSLFERLRTSFLENSNIRQNIIRVSNIDGQANMIFQCQRFQNQNTSVWASFRGSGSTDANVAVVGIFVSYGSSSVAVRKIFWNSTGIHIEDLTNTVAANDGVVATILIL